MSKRKRLEEGLADLFSSRLEGDSIEVEEEFSMDELAAVEPVDDETLRREEPLRRAEPPQRAEPPDVADQQADESPSAGEEAESATMDSETSAVEAPAVEDLEPVSRAPAPASSARTAEPDESEKPSPIAIQKPEAAPSVESKPIQSTAAALEWMEQHPEAGQDLKAFAEAVRSMPQVGEEEAEAESSDEEADELNVARFVVFDLGEIIFGVDVHSVLTIIKMMDICPVPHTPAYISGLINLRGQIIPVLDLGKRVEISDREMTDDHRIVVVEQEKHLFGLIVDRVRSVAQVPVESIKEPSRMISRVQEEYLSGIAETDYGLVLLLELERLLQR